MKLIETPALPAIFLLPHTVTMLPLVRENFKKICAEAGLLDLFVWQIHESCFCKNLRDFNLHWEDGSLGAKKRPNRWGNMSVEPWALSEYNILQHYVTNSIIFDTRYSTCSGFYNFLTQQNFFVWILIPLDGAVIDGDMLSIVLSTFLARSSIYR